MRRRGFLLWKTSPSPYPAFSPHTNTPVRGGGGGGLGRGHVLLLPIGSEVTNGTWFIHHTQVAHAYLRLTTRALPPPGGHAQRPRSFSDGGGALRTRCWLSCGAEERTDEWAAAGHSDVVLKTQDVAIIMTQCRGVPGR
jgi:hypothetical protein